MSGAAGAERSLGGAAARGGLVLGTASVAENGFQFLRAVLLARILSPRDFGLMGMALIVVQAGESLSQTGFYRALVQKRGDPEAYLDTVWFVSAVRGAALSALAWLAAPLLAAFFDTPEVTAILRTVGLVFVIQGVLNPALFLLERDMAFVRYSVPRVAGLAADLAFSVALALVQRSVWGMVWGFLLGKAVYVAVSYAVRPYAPRGGPEWAQAREFYLYGRHVFRAAAMEYVVGQTDKVLVGRLLGADPLGLYSFASRLAGLPSVGLYSAVFRVAFPVFSRVQEDARRLRAGYLRGLAIMTAVSAPIAAGLWAVAPDLVAVVFGERWSAMTPAFRVLSLGGAPLALYYTTGAVLGGIGRADLGARGAYVFLGALIVPIYPVIQRWGILGAAWAVTVAGAGASVYLVWRTQRLLECGLPAVARALAPSLAAAAVMAAGIAASRGGFPAPATWAILCVEVAAGALAYAGLAAALDLAFSGGIVASFRPVRRSG